MFDAMGAKPTRRYALWISAATVGGAGFFWWQRSASLYDRVPVHGPGDDVSIVEFSDAGERLATKRVSKVVRSESEWWDRLTRQQYYVTRRHTTDSPFTGTYFQKHEAGIYRCVCCETALFSSEAKYDSGTGWPSFWEPIAKENVRAVETPGMAEEQALASGIEVLCQRCDAHLGHIFGDGPAPTNLRYCINESALEFRALRADSAQV